MGTDRGHLERIVMTFYLVHPLLLLYICPVGGKDHSITLVSFNNRYQKVLNLLKKALDYMERQFIRLLQFLEAALSLKSQVYQQC